MSITISNCNEICNAPTNQSSAKMLYSFPKQGRFLKRKTILYWCPYSDVTSSTNSKTPSPTGRPPSGMDTNMTSPRSLPAPHLQTPTISMTNYQQVPRRASLLDKAGRGWLSQVLSWELSATRTQAQATMNPRPPSLTFYTLFLVKSNTWIRNRSMFLGLDNIQWPSPLARTVGTSMLSIKTAVWETLGRY